MRLITGRKPMMRLLVPATATVLLAGVLLAGVLALTWDRAGWIDRHVRDAEIAARAVPADPGGAVDATTASALLRLAGAVTVRLSEPGRPPLLLGGPAEGDLPAATAAGVAAPTAAGVAAPTAGRITAARIIDLRDETPLDAVGRSLTALLADDNTLLRAEAPAAQTTAARLEVLLPGAALGRDLRRLAGGLALSAALGALLAGLLVATARPRPPVAAARAGAEPARPTRDERAAEWRAARLAALVATIGRAGHDLRGILSPTLLMAERLQMNADPKVVRAGDVVVRDVERATDLLRRIVEYARETPPTLAPMPLDLREAVADAATRSAAATPALVVENLVPEATAVHADPASLARVFATLLANAAEAGAGRVRIAAAATRGEVAVTIEDDGPGLPASVQAAPFRPRVAEGDSGLGLATAHDLARAQGGELALLHTGPAGTAFRLTLPTPQARVPLTPDVPAVARPAA